MPIKNKILIVCLLCQVTFISSLFQSCNSVCSCKQVPCPGYYNPNFDEWFPYDSGQKIIYTDSRFTRSDTTNFLNVSLRAPYDARKGCYNGDIGCLSDKYIYSNLFSFGYNSTSNWDGSVVDSNYTLSVYDFSASAKVLKPGGFESLSLPSAFYNEIELNGKNYQNVQSIWRTDTAVINSGVYKIFIQKNTGLLAYQYYPSQLLLVKK